MRSLFVGRALVAKRRLIALPMAALVGVAAVGIASPESHDPHALRLSAVSASEDPLKTATDKTANIGIRTPSLIGVGALLAGTGGFLGGIAALLNALAVKGGIEPAAVGVAEGNDYPVSVPPAVVAP